METIRIGTRDSELAIWQALEVKKKLEKLGQRSVLVPLKSKGDIDLDKPIYEMGITGVFTKTLDIALLNEEIDLAVHSLKDVPTKLPNNITMPAGTTLCQQLGTFPLLSNPINGTWSVLPDNPQSASNCLNAIVTFPYQVGWENGLNGWTHDVGNDFDWTLNSGGTPSGSTGPGSAYEGYNYIYTEASNPNFPGKRAAIISPCLNLSEYDNPVLHFALCIWGGDRAVKVELWRRGSFNQVRTKVIEGFLVLGKLARLPSIDQY